MKSNLGPRFKTALPYIIVTAVLYIAATPLLAFLEMLTAGGSGMLLLAAPIATCCLALAVGYFYGKKASRDPIMPLMSALLFIPLMFIYFNLSAWIYIPVAAVCSFIGECFGAVHSKFGK